MKYILGTHKLITATTMLMMVSGGHSPAIDCYYLLLTANDCQLDGSSCLEFIRSIEDFPVFALLLEHADKDVFKPGSFVDAQVPAQAERLQRTLRHRAAIVYSLISTCKAADVAHESGWRTY